jgi:peptidoglycan LD-endopeptidase LytH
MSAVAHLAPASRWGRCAVVLGLTLLAVTESAGPLAGRGWGQLAAAQTLDDLDAAEEVVDELTAARAAAIDRYEAAWATIERSRVELAALERSTERLAAEVTATTQALERRARLAFMRGPMESLEVLLQPEAAQLAVERVALLSALQRRDRIEVEQAAAGQVALDQSRELIRVREEELLALQEVLEAEAEVLQDELEQASEEAAGIRSLVARQRRIDRGAQQGIYACIFDRGATRFRDTWGAPRSGGRRHKGTDLFAAYRAPVYAITSGVVQRHSRSGLGGIGLYLRGDDGNTYYYAHLDSIHAGASVGTRVTAGELVGRNGYTGNASRSAPHVHFELHPGGGAAINPYPWLAAACF